MPYADYEPLLAHARNLDEATPVPQEDIEPYRGILPDGLLEFWARHGNQLVFGEGFMQMCDPRTFAPVIRDWFEGDPEFDPEQLIAYALDSHGTIRVCDGTSRNGGIHSTGSEFTYGQFNPPPTGENYLDYFIAHVLKLGTVTPRYIDKHDLFNASVREHGPLSQGEMFGWVPALQIAERGNEIEKLDAETHIAFLQELGPLKYIADEFTSDGIFLGTNFKRFIGPQG